MEVLTLAEIEKAVNGKLYNNKDVEITSVDTDSRKEIVKGLFIPIVGENFDGHDFISKAIDNGAVAVLTQIELAINEPYIIVSDTKKALMDLATYYLEKLRDETNLKVVGITGSVGKTSTKDFIASVLSAKYKVLKTEGNFNNEIGLPITVFNVDKNHSVVVLEMGMNHFGEIHNLSRIAKPDIVVITNIGMAHAEFLGGREGVFKAKCEIFDFMQENAKILLCGDDDLLRTIKNDDKVKNKENIYYYGINQNNDFIGSNIKYLPNLSGMNFKLTYKGSNLILNLPFAGEHMVTNGIVASAIGVLLGLNQREIKYGLENAKLSKMRQKVSKSNHNNLRGTTNVTVLNDCYNANPVSTMASIDVLTHANGRKVAILGDMFELGEYTKEGHFTTGEYAYKVGIDVLVAIGDNSKHIYDGFAGNKKRFHFETVNKCIEELPNIIKTGDTILVKASRSMKLEEIAEYILK